MAKSILGEMEYLTRKMNCQEKNHVWEYDTSHAGLSIWFCKYCPDMLTEIEDCNGG